MRRNEQLPLMNTVMAEKKTKKIVKNKNEILPKSKLMSLDFPRSVEISKSEIKVARSAAHLNDIHRRRPRGPRRCIVTKIVTTTARRTILYFIFIPLH